MKNDGFHGNDGFLCNHDGFSGRNDGCSILDLQKMLEFQTPDGFHEPMLDLHETVMDIQFSWNGAMNQ